MQVRLIGDSQFSVSVNGCWFQCGRAVSCCLFQGVTLWNVSSILLINLIIIDQFNSLTVFLPDSMWQLSSQVKVCLSVSTRLPLWLDTNEQGYMMPGYQMNSDFHEILDLSSILPIRSDLLKHDGPWKGLRYLWPCKWLYRVKYLPK